MLGLLKKLFAPPVVKAPSPIDEALAKLEKLEPLIFKYAQSSNLSTFRVLVLFSPIDNYRNFLETAGFRVERDEVIFHSMVDHPIIEIPIGEFFLGRNRTFIDEVKAAEDFINQCKIFLSIYKELVDNPDISITNEHNERMLRAVTHNLFSLIDSLSEVQYLR
jgi:hypothetical protein